MKTPIQCATTLTTLALAIASASCQSGLASGSIVAWGRNHYGQTKVPRNLNDVVAVAPRRQRGEILLTRLTATTGTRRTQTGMQFTKKRPFRVS